MGDISSDRWSTKREKKKFVLEKLRKCSDDRRDGLGITNVIVGPCSLIRRTGDLAKLLQELIDEKKVEIRVKAKAGEKYWEIEATYWPAEIS